MFAICCVNHTVSMYLSNILTKRLPTFAILSANGRMVANTRVMGIFVNGWLVENYVSPWMRGHLWVVQIVSFNHWKGTFESFERHLTGVKWYSDDRKVPLERLESAIGTTRKCHRNDRKVPSLQIVSLFIIKTPQKRSLCRSISSKQRDVFSGI